MSDFLGEKLRKLRVLNGYSQEYVADQIGVSLSSYQRYEAAKVSIDIYSVVKLAEMYKLTLDELYHFGDEGFNVKEPKESYLKKMKVSVTVDLDGLDSTLEFWIKRLTAINSII